MFGEDQVQKSTGCDLVIDGNYSGQRVGMILGLSVDILWWTGAGSVLVSIGQVPAQHKIFAEYVNDMVRCVCMTSCYR